MEKRGRVPNHNLPLGELSWGLGKDGPCDFCLEEIKLDYTGILHDFYSVPPKQYSFNPIFKYILLLQNTDKDLQGIFLLKGVSPKSRNGNRV